jgi:CBS domain-containing protein
MKAADVMTPTVVTVHRDASVMEVVRLMLQHKFSGIPVVDDKGALIGMVTEGDLLRRVEISTRRVRPRWIELFIGHGRLAAEFTHACGRKVHEVMNSNVYTVPEDAPLDQIVQLMERHQIKRLPVVRAGKLVGIVSRANLLHALASIAVEAKLSVADDATIRKRLYEQLRGESWAPANLPDIVVRNGVVNLWGTLFDERQRDAIRVAAENTPGVKAVEDHLVWVEPLSGMVMRSPENAETQTKPS